MGKATIRSKTKATASATETAAARPPGPAFEGHVDFYGHHAGAGGWFVGGWLSHPWPHGEAPRAKGASFADGVADRDARAVFFHREDVSGRGIGFIFFMRPASALRGALLSLDVLTGTAMHTLRPTPGVQRLDGLRLAAHLATLLEAAADGSESRDVRSLLSGGMQAAPAAGAVDTYGFSPGAGGWFICGWLAAPWPYQQPPPLAVAGFETGEAAGEAFAIVFPRSDLPPGGEGFVLFIRDGGARRGPLLSVTLEVAGTDQVLSAGARTALLRDADLADRLGPEVRQGVGPHRDVLLGLLTRRPYRGEDTLATLATPVRFAIDEAIRVGEAGLVLMGWLLAHPGEVEAIRIRCGEHAAVLDLNAAIRIDRMDVLDGHAALGFADPKCGFIAYVEDGAGPGGPIHIEVETVRQELGYYPVAAPKLTGLAAIKRLLGAVDVRFSEVRRAFDLVLGPAVAALNESRLAVRPAVTVTRYGPVPVAPRCSVIIPLYGRLDYVEYQLALFSAHPGSAGIEFIYVLDEPARQREAQFLFASAYARFAVPFTAVLLGTNTGFGPATNIGLRHATGRFVAFVNSDVFPGTPDWLERLADRLEADPAIGVIGPLLLFEDGAVQHHGMVFERLAEFGGMAFGMHPDKGLRPAPGRGLETHASITGACMVLPRALALEVGGFDEAFVIGDFEDSDLCLKVQALGYRCVVDTTVELYHLERKSQAGSALGWRMNLTVYNAWQHDRRWGATIAAARQA